jgi:L-ascorbate metabolism protein UlaG (beta-lactamase superfamily)
VVRLTIVGHATVLVEIDGIPLLTGSVRSRPTSPSGSLRAGRSSPKLVIPARTDGE